MHEKIFITGTGACGFLETFSLLRSKFDIVYKSENSKLQNGFTEQTQADFPIWDKEKCSPKKINKIVDRLISKSLISHILIKYIDEMVRKDPSILILCLRGPRDVTVRNLVWSWGYTNPLVTTPRNPKREVNRYPLSQFPDFSWLSTFEDATYRYYDIFNNLAEHYSEKYPRNFKIINSDLNLANQLYELNLISQIPQTAQETMEIYTTNLNGGLGNMLFQISETLSFAREFGYPTPRFGYWEENGKLVFPKFYKPDVAFGGHDITISEFNHMFENIKLEKLDQVNFRTHFQVNNMFNFSSISSQNEIRLKSHLRPRSNSVAVHLRFGGLSADASRVPKIRDKFYKKVFERIPKSLPVYVFSDNSEAANLWISKFSKKLGRNFSLLDLDAADSLVTMTNCEYHVLHSSTFSFWSAFLDASQPNSKVFYPKEFLSIHGPKMIPYPEWICL
jgi:hypothetical protein